MAVDHCGICGKAVEPLLDFGKQPLANSYLSVGETDKVWYRAVWGWCDECQMLQLVDIPNVSMVFNAEYPYITDQSQFMMTHFRKTAEYLEEKYDLAGRKVLEIGANSGGMIEHLRRTKVIAVEPARASQEILLKKDIPFWDSMFTSSVAKTIRKEDGLFKMVYCANTLRSLENLDDFFRGVLEVLDGDGVFVFEEPYLPDILDRNEFDQFYSENVYGFTLTSVERLANRYGMSIVMADALADNHGGSVRYHVSRFGNDTIYPFECEIPRERRIRDRCVEMYEHAKRIGDDFEQALIKNTRGAVGYGATAKSSTILNWRGIGSSLISKIYDSTPTKIGKLTPGTHIPIVDAAEFSDDHSETVVLFPYNLKQEIIPRENAIRQRRWLLYAPEVHYD